jgi:hypothetical protein
MTMKELVKGLKVPTPLDTQTLTGRKWSPSQTQRVRSLNTRDLLVLSVKMKGTTLLLEVLPRWELSYSWGKGRSFYREIERDGSWYFPGLRNRPQWGSYTLDDHTVRTFRPVKTPKTKTTPKTKGETKTKTTPKRTRKTTPKTSPVVSQTS